MLGCDASPEIEKIGLINDDSSTHFYSLNTLKTLKVIRALMRSREFIYFQLSTFTAVLLYELTTSGCHLREDDCMYNFFLPRLRLWIIYLVVVGLIFALQIKLVLFKNLKRVYAIQIMVILAFLLIFEYSSYNLRQHRGYNKAILGLFIVVWFILLCLGHCLYKCFKKHPKIFIFSTIVFIIVLAVTLPYLLASSCDHWSNGFKGSKLDNDVNKCKVASPPICWYDIANKKMDLSYAFGIDCKKNFGDHAITAPYFKDTVLIGMPRTENYNKTDRSFDSFQNKVLNGYLDLNNMSNIEAKDALASTEVILDRSNPHRAEVSINIKRNETLVNEAKEKIKKRETQPLAKNVIVIFVDALSRADLPRKLPLTHRWMEKFYNNKNSSHEAFQFFKYNSLAPFTVSNMIPFMFGDDYGSDDKVEVGADKVEQVNTTATTENSTIIKPSKNLRIQSETIKNTSAINGSNVTNTSAAPKKNLTQYLKNFKEQGFITGQSRDQCCPQAFDYGPDDYKRLNWESFDHENIALFCDLNFKKPGDVSTIQTGAYSSFRRCLYGHDTYQYVLEYGAKFWDTYSDVPKYLEMSFLDHHEGTGEVVKYMDSDLSGWLKTLHEKDQLEDTAIMFFADHGLHMWGPLHVLGVKNTKIEVMLPVLSVMLPRKLADEKGRGLKSNEQSLVTAFDMHNLMQDISGVAQKSPKGLNLFKQIHADRTCKESGVPEDSCICG